MDAVPRFLNDQWIATLATVDKRGKPHAVPLWFTFHKGKLYLHTDRKSVKVSHVLHNPNVAVAVYNMHEEAVIIRGKARTVDDEKQFRKLTQAHIDKYNRLFNIAHKTKEIKYIKLDAEGRDNMGIPLFNFKVRCVIEIAPEKILFW
jgi:nitroimidazol reductase NimA-like FMN-containing flavoprotein (pyridoxamine 5'-phosphate oxidase superfamily)